jgi:glycosyltransferase involved in cell wall biosynthesis
LKNEFVICYTGALGIANDIPFILKLIQIAQRNYINQFYFLIAGKGAKYDWVVSMANEYQLSNVRFLGHLNKEEIRELYSIADANLVTFLPIPILETNSPNKFFDGLAAGKLTIVNTGGWMKKLCESHQCGIYASDPTHLFELLNPFVKDKNLLTTYGANARNLAEKEFERKIILKRFLNLFDLVSS